MTVAEIIKKYLAGNGNNGLFNDTGGCACEADDLSPGDCLTVNCVAGYKVLCTKACAEDESHDGYDPDDPNCWHIQKEKP